MRRRWRMPAAAGLSVLLAGGLIAAVSGGPAVSAPEEGDGRTGVSAPAPARSVTLITGDRVQLDDDGRVTSVRPAAGREEIPVAVRAAGDRTLVLPADVTALVARGELDRRLFDVGTLAEYGYDDAARDHLPVIVIHSAGAGRQLVASAAGAETERELPSVSATAVAVEREAGAAFWETVTDEASGPARSLAAGVEKIWLDGRVEGSLDESVPQVGAPQAWEAGFDGTGVTVAVLDTGIDDTHPDLQGKVAAAENFSASPDSVDRFGHGTHVASIVAGQGDQYRGVAPGATLLNGKVLDDDGFATESEVIAGMEWAVEQGADVVNLSLGGEDYRGLDVVEEALETLSEQSGALFVAAAGNFGPDDRTIDSPASAPSALAVGAVDKQDAIADFSARGATADGLLKPDVTAPGVDITAARASGIDEGEGAYLTADGTSMATPHVAGAAAILAQQHPGWEGADIRAALAASAAPGPLSSYVQGAGRVDVGAAVAQTVTVPAGPVDFGLHEYPHEGGPVSEELTYRNDGDEPVELELTLDAYGPDGAPAPDGVLTLDETGVTVPAGDEASVTVTADTGLDTPFGGYGGTVSAVDADAGVTVSTAVGVWKEGPMYDVTVTVLDEDGQPTEDAFVDLVGLEEGHWESGYPDESGELTLRVPEDDYHVFADVWLDGWDTAWLVLPRLEVAADIEIVLDAREAEPFDVTVPDPAAEATWSVYGYAHLTETSSFFADFFMFDGGLESLRVAQLGPAGPDDELAAAVSGQWTAGPPDDRRWYHASWQETGTLLAGLEEAPGPAEFAQVDTVLGDPSGLAGLYWAGWLDELRGYTAVGFDAELPATGVNHVLGNDVPWTFGVDQYGTDADDYYGATSVRSVPRGYAPGEAPAESYNVGVFGPAMPQADEFAEPGLFRSDGELWALVPTFGAGTGTLGYSVHTEATSTLRIDGELVFSDETALYDGEDFPAGPWPVPSGAGEFELSTDVRRSAEIASVSSRVQATWTFQADAVSDDDVQEILLSAVQFSPELAPDSTAPAGQALEIPYRVEGAAEGRVDELTVEVSYDEGDTWEAVTVQDDSLVVDHPAEPGSVSLRAGLTDQDGGTLEQTIERAYLTVETDEPEEPEPTPTPTPSPEPTDEPTATPSPTPPPPDDPDLPDTGLDGGPWLSAGLALVLGGGLLLAGRRYWRALAAR